MKKIIILATLCLHISFISCVQTVVDTGVTIYGTVYDATTKEPIKGALLTLSPSGRSCYSQRDGAFNFEENIEPGQYQVTAIANGYHSDWRRVKLTAGESANVTIALERE